MYEAKNQLIPGFSRCLDLSNAVVSYLGLFSYNNGPLFIRSGGKRAHTWNLDTHGPQIYVSLLLKSLFHLSIVFFVYT